MGERLSDAELLGSAVDHPAAFLVFYERYEAAVVTYFRRQVRDAELVADLTAEVFAAALGAAPRYRAVQDTAAPWLLTIAHNTLRRSLRAKRVEARARRRLGICEPVAFLDEELDRVERLADPPGSVLALLDALPPEQAQAVRARVLEERGYREIAAELQTSELVVRKRVSRGLGALRESLESEERP